MNIAVDVREWRSGTSTGIARVLSNFLEWATENSDHRFLLCGNQLTEFRSSGGTIDELVIPETSRLLWDQWSLPRVLSTRDVDVLLSPYYKGPLRAPCPVVMTANDLIELHFPRPGVARRQLVPRWIRLMLSRAAHVLTLSEYSRQDVMSLLGVPAAKITAFPLAVDDRFLEPVADAAITETLEKYGLESRYVVYVGRCADHKNVATLVRAWGAMSLDLRQQFSLVLAGSDVARFEELARHHGVEASTPGFVADADLASLYAGATAMAFPSLYEGFGLPPLEAMACGTAVVAARATSVPEVVGDAALLVEPLDVGGWANALETLLHDHDLRRDMVAKGRAHAKTFTKDRGGRIVLDTLVRAAEASS